jgi:peptidoglycan/xylan/chitin deacetylase (PgdA/CDA1 family)
LSTPRVLVVCYHAVSSAWPSSLAVSEDLLKSHLSLLRRRGYEGLTFAESERRRSAGTLPERCIVVTFDDGFASILRAKGILDQLGFPATVFVVTSFVDSGDLLRWPGMEPWHDRGYAEELRPLAWTDLEALADDGWEIGSHTVSHPLLPTLSDADLVGELESSRESIARRLGRCETIAYPYGRADERVAAAVRGAGYLAGCTVTGAHGVDEPYRRPRLWLSAADRGPRLWLQLSPLSGRLRRSMLAHSIRRLRPRRDWLPPEAR